MPPTRSIKLTPAQGRELRRLNETGFTEHRVRFGASQTNRPLWVLVELGLAEFGWGPKDSFLRTQGFLPTKEGSNAPNPFD